MGNSCVQFDLFKSRAERQLSIRRPQLWTFYTSGCSFSGDWSALLVRAQQSRARHTILAESLQYTQSSLDEQGFWGSCWFQFLYDAPMRWTPEEFNPYFWDPSLPSATLSAFKENFYQVVNVRKTRLEQEGSSTDSRSLFILHSKIAEKSNLVAELGATKAARPKQQKVTI